MAGITTWFWVTIEGYLSYLLPKYEDLVPTSLSSGAIQTRRKCVSVPADYCRIFFLFSSISPRQRGVAEDAAELGPVGSLRSDGCGRVGGGAGRRAAPLRRQDDGHKAPRGRPSHAGRHVNQITEALGIQSKKKRLHEFFNP